MARGEYLQYGGQAVIEGVMMRSPRFFSIACRAPDGSIVQKTERIEATWIGRQKWLKAPFLRGSLALFDSMALGIRAMRFASAVQMQGDESMPKGRVQDAAITATIITSLAFGIGLFVVLPNFLAQFLEKGGAGGTTINFVAEIIKIVFFLGYIGLISRLKEIREVFKYHGAEHKSINAFEAHQELTIENALGQTRLHPRCGTSFAIIVLFVSLLIFTFVPRYPLGESTHYLFNVLVRVGVELLILPFISGISYELIRIAGKFRNQRWVNLLFAPGLMSQYMTTREPEADKVEVALAALRSVIAAEEAGEVRADDVEPEPALAMP